MLLEAAPYRRSKHQQTRVGWSVCNVPLPSFGVAPRHFVKQNDVPLVRRPACSVGRSVLRV